MESENPDNQSELSKRRICSDCVTESFLRAEIENQGEEAVCLYCENRGKTISIEQIAERIGTAFAQHFELTATEPTGFESTLIKETDYEWHREGENVVSAIGGAAGVNEVAAEDIRHVLYDTNFDFERDTFGDEGPFDAGARYIEKAPDDFEFQVEWSAFETALKRQARFFNRSAQATLATVFKDVDAQRTRDGRQSDS